MEKMFTDKTNKIVEELRKKPAGGWDGVGQSTDPVYKNLVEDLEKEIHHQNGPNKPLMIKCSECGKKFPAQGGKKQCSIICETNAAYNEKRKSQADKADLTIDDYEHCRHLPKWEEVRFGIRT